MGKKQIEWTEERIEYLIRNYYSGDVKEMLSVLGITYEALKSAAKRFGVKRDVNLKYLNKLLPLLNDTPIIWYWLGFIIADGWLGDNGDLKISISEKDKNHLKKIADMLGVKIYKRKGLTYKNHTSKDFYEMAVRDVINGIKIKKMFAITERKSITGCSLDVLDTEKKLFSFLGGFIDGDGCITQNKKTGNANMIRIQCHSSWLDNFIFLSEKINLYSNINFKTQIDKQGYSKMTLYKNKEIKKLKQILENLDVPLLTRKWEKI